MGLGATVERGDEVRLGSLLPRSGVQPLAQPPLSVPWLLPARPIASSTIARVSGQNRRAQRIDMPPWLGPITATRRPDQAADAANRVHQVLARHLDVVLGVAGIVIPHQGIPRAVSERM